MPHIRADRVMEVSTTTGTGTMTVAGAVLGYGTLASRLSVSDTFDYAIFAVDGTGTPTGAWETGVGTYTAANQFTRSVRQSSNGDALVNFASGTKYVALTATASELARIVSGQARSTITKTGTAENLLAADVGAYQRFTATTAKTLTVRPDGTHALPADGEWHIRNAGAGTLTIVAGSGVTINSPAGGSLNVPPGGTVTLKRVALNELDLLGLTDAP